MSLDRMKGVKRSRCINTWFTPTNNSTTVSSSVASVSAPNVEHPQPSESPAPDSPNVDFNPLGNTNGIERDPGKQLAIWKYPVNERESVRRAYIFLGPNQPKLSKDEYPLTFDNDGKQQRRFNAEWFIHHPWLEYSMELDKVYCFPCFLFDKEYSQHATFTIHGFRNWKRCGAKRDNPLVGHVGCINSPHNVSMQKWISLKNPSMHIETIIQPILSKDVEDNRLRLKATIESVRLLANQGQAFRGHDESKNSLNAGNFIQVIKSFARMSVEVDRVVLDNAPGNAKYTAPTIQKEILNILGNKVRKKIIEEMGDAKFCILVDEAVDVAGKEQMSIILRYVDRHGLVRERFFKIVSVPNTNSLTLKNEISRVLGMFNLQVTNMRGQGYDGASNMSGVWNGLQALFREECPFAYYVHCFAHRLQLALNTSAKDVGDVWAFFFTLNVVIIFLDKSAKRKFDLKLARAEEVADLVAIGDLDTGKGANQGCTLQQAGATRWGSHFRSINSLIKLYGVSQTTLNKLLRDGSKTSKAIQAEALSVLKAMRCFDFVFILHLMHRVMKITDHLSQVLQTKNIDIVHAMSFVRHTRSLLQDMRENGWPKLVESVESFCKTHNIDMLDMTARHMDGTGRSCQQRDVISNEHHFHVNVFNVVIDISLSELDRRFDDESTELLMLSFTLDPRDSFRQFDVDKVCTLANKFYPDDFNHGQQVSLEAECAFYKKDIITDTRFKELSSISELCGLLVQTRKAELYPMIYRLICLVLTLPVSTATTERAFSSMNHIKNKLRNKIEDDFLDDCMVLYIENEFLESIEHDEVIEEFEATTSRGVQFS